ncbi:MAG: Asp-tRNA(Asn)/Glu-tRNA(Gln) amidotransferase subunit GatC [Candidatus Promineifilaceae bacterium]|nr:Asp-tRNA(Asn)/Glu-tRNA(Gln) amidotransferase subunit GatC [Candidatus Promineifilaceae bacterium]
MMTLSKKDVEKIAQLARLALSSSEISEYQRQLSAILEYAEMLDELEHAGLDARPGQQKRNNVMREDVVEPGLALEDVLFNAAQHAQDQFLIQPVLED